MNWKRDLAASIKLFLALAVLFGGLYSLAVLGIAQGLFPQRANGSLVTAEGRVAGSRLIGQSWTGPGWFHGRPSATTGADGRPDPYNAADSGGSNLGPTNPALLQQVRAALAREPGVPPSRVPASLVESSASGLDPDITPAGARVQIPRIAAARHLPAVSLEALVRRRTHARWLGLFGHAYVNVLDLNLALARAAGG